MDFALERSVQVWATFLQKWRSKSSISLKCSWAQSAKCSSVEATWVTLAVKYPEMVLTSRIPTTALPVVFPSSSLTSISRRDLGMPWIPKATCSFLAWSGSSTEIHHQAQSGTLGLSVRSLHSLVVWPPPRNDSFSSFMSSEPNRSSGSSMRTFGWEGGFYRGPHLSTLPSRSQGTPRPRASAWARAMSKQAILCYRSTCMQMVNHNTYSINRW